MFGLFPLFGKNIAVNFDAQVFCGPNLDTILKSRDITLPTKVHLVKAMVFPVVCIDVRVGHKEGRELKN